MFICPPVRPTFPNIFTSKAIKLKLSHNDASDIIAVSFLMWLFHKLGTRPILSLQLQHNNIQWCSVDKLPNLLTI